jgi:transposase InsO family protein
MADKSITKAPEVEIEIDSPYFIGKVKAIALDNPIYPLLIGNIAGARCYNNPDSTWSQKAAVTTRAQAKKADRPLKPLEVGKVIQDIDINREELIKLQRDDPDLRKYWTKETIHTKDQKKEFKVKSGVLYRQFQHSQYNNGEEVSQLMVPSQLKEHVLQLAHEAPLAGHLGIKKTMDRIQTHFYWPGVQGDVSRYCNSCDICQKTVKKGSISKAKLGQMPLIDTPFKRVAVDLVGPISPVSESGFRYILTLVDYATRYPEAIPLKSITTEAVAEALIDIFSRLGIPDEILSDLGTQFISDLMKEVARLLKVKRLTTTPYHPMCNGLVERFNGTLKAMLKKLCVSNPKQWDRFINAALFAYREVPQESTGFSPFELLYGRTVKGPMSILKSLWSGEDVDEETKTTYRYVLELREKLDSMMELAQETMAKSQRRNKFYFDKHAKDRKFKDGDQVLVLLPTNSSKLLMQWKGPYQIIKSNHRLNNYVIQLEGGKTKTFHANLLKKYHSRSVDAVSIKVNYTESASNVKGIEHIKGRDNVGADFMSRMHADSEEEIQQNFS